MSLFPAPESSHRTRGGTIVGWIALGVGAIAIAAAGVIPAPYVIQQPGPVLDTLGTVTVDDKKVSMIEIDGEKTYPTDGRLDMLTVTIAGNREDLPGWLEIAVAWLDPSKAVVPVDEIYPEGVTVEQSNQQGRVEMANSQQEAIAAALTELGYEFQSTLRIVETMKDGPADGLLKAGDIIDTVNGERFADVTSLRAAVAENGTADPAQVSVFRSGRLVDVEIVPELSRDGDGPPVMGILVGSDYTFPIDIKIQLERIGGPSAGMMFSLGIIDKLTPGELAGGEHVAGSGTITAQGDVGPIGGIRQKMYGALDAGAEWFLSPTGNCGEVNGHVPSGLRVFAVSSLDESLAVLEAIRSGDGLEELPTCETAQAAKRGVVVPV